MRDIVKGLEPRTIADTRHATTTDLSTTVRARAAFDQVDKAAVRSALVKEQGWLCAFCMRRIRPENDKGVAAMRIAHRAPIEGAPTLALTWKNLLGSCEGRERSNRPDKTCDVAQRSTALSLDPTVSGACARLRYERRSDKQGLFITSDDPEHRKDVAAPAARRDRVHDPGIGRGKTLRMARVLVILAQGAEEMETTITVDVLRRGGIDVVLAGLDGGGPVKCSRGVHIVPDTSLADAKGPFDVVALPGGLEGAKRLADSPAVGALLRAQEAAGLTTAAICAAPIALAKHDVYAGHQLTSYPSVHDVVGKHGTLVLSPVVTDRNLVTSQGPGTAFAFALALVERLAGKETADNVRKGMLLPA